MDPAQVYKDAHARLRGEGIPAGARAEELAAFVDADVSPALLPRDGNLVTLHMQFTKETTRIRGLAAEEFLLDRADDTPFLLELFAAPWSHRVADLVASCLSDERIAELLEVCDNPSRCFASLSPRSSKHVALEMLEREQCLPHAEILVGSMPACALLSVLAYAEASEEMTRAVYERLGRPTFGEILNRMRCNGPLSTGLARIVCEHQVRLIRAWDSRTPGTRRSRRPGYPDGSAVGFAGCMHRIKFEEPDVGSEVFQRVVDAMRLNHPEPSEADRRVLGSGGSLDNQFAVVVTVSALIENRGLKDDVKRLREERDALADRAKRLREERDALADRAKRLREERDALAVCRSQSGS